MAPTSLLNVISRGAPDGSCQDIRVWAGILGNNESPTDRLNMALTAGAGQAWPDGAWLR
ncbi:MAG: hypothetical protein JWQ22_1400 [Devosia sp.]|nr:hypothetical protein [Devosia sp.]